MKKTSPISVVLAFLVVAVPLGWGLYRSVINSMPLFTAAKAVAPVQVASPAAPTAPAPTAAPTPAAEPAK